MSSAKDQFTWIILNSLGQTDQSFLQRCSWYLIFHFIATVCKNYIFSGYRQRGHLLSCKRYYALLICCSLSHFSLSHRVSRPLTRQIIEITTSSMLLLSIVCYVSLSAICPPVKELFEAIMCIYPSYQTDNGQFKYPLYKVDKLWVDIRDYN